MEFLKIGKNKLKITLTIDELRKYKLDKIDADDDLAPYRRALFRVIDMAGKSAGFSPGAEKLLIQFYPTRRGAEIFVTKLYIATEAQKSIISRADNLTTATRSRRAYLFESLSDAISLAKSISSKCATLTESTLYITEFGTAVLEVEEYSSDEAENEFPELSEFSDRLTDEFFAYLREHSIPLYESNAIKELSSL